MYQLFANQLLQNNIKGEREREERKAEKNIEGAKKKIKKTKQNKCYVLFDEFFFFVFRYKHYRIL